MQNFLTVNPIKIGINFDNGNGTRLNLVFKMMPLDGKMASAGQLEK